MSLHDIMAADLAHITGDTEHGHALPARLGEHHISGILAYETTETIPGALKEGYTFRVAEAALPGRLATDNDWGTTLTVFRAPPRNACRYTVESIQPEGDGEVLLILRPA